MVPNMSNTAGILRSSEFSKAVRRPNGFSNFLREYGLIYFSAYFIIVFYGYKRIFFYHHNYYKTSYALFGVFLLWLLSFSEIIFDLPFLKALIFLGMVYLPEMEYVRENEILEREVETA